MEASLLGLAQSIYLENVDQTIVVKNGTNDFAKEHSTGKKG